jgi:ferritin
MLNPKMQDAFNKQMNAEFYSSYLYLSMCAYFESKNLKGMAHWMSLQCGEERLHAMRFYNYVNSRSGRVTLTQIDAPKTEWKSPLDAFEDAYKHELKISGLINELMNLTMAEKDHAAHDFLEWFVQEQVEEEGAAQLIVDQLKMVGDNGVGLFMLDQQLSQRVASAPPPAK